MVDGGLGVVVAPAGRLLLAMKIKVKNGKIAAINAFADRDRLDRTDFALPPEIPG
ncbi:MAG: hypothetical protein ACREFW_09995 [Rhizomicrobium sp.]